jgi:hypothetical protein
MSENESKLSYGFGYVIQENEPAYLIGRLLTIIDSLGLKETQEKAVKDLIKNEVWGIINETAQYIPPVVNDVIHSFFKEYNFRKGNINMPFDIPQNLKVAIEKIEK